MKRSKEDLRYYLLSNLFTIQNLPAERIIQQVKYGFAAEKNCRN
jgi:hypothetical protein